MPKCHWLSNGLPLDITPRDIAVWLSVSVYTKSFKQPLSSLSVGLSDWVVSLAVHWPSGRPDQEASAGQRTTKTSANWSVMSRLAVSNDVFACWYASRTSLLYMLLGAFAYFHNLLPWLIKDKSVRCHSAVTPYLKYLLNISTSPQTSLWRFECWHSSKAHLCYCSWLSYWMKEILAIFISI